jgi:hypothetical protein
MEWYNMDRDGMDNGFISLNVWILPDGLCKRWHVVIFGSFSALRVGQSDGWCRGSGPLQPRIW